MYSQVFGTSVSRSFMRNWSFHFSIAHNATKISIRCLISLFLCLFLYSVFILDLQFDFSFHFSFAWHYFFLHCFSCIFFRRYFDICALCGYVACDKGARGETSGIFCGPPAVWSPMLERLISSTLICPSYS